MRIIVFGVLVLVVFMCLVEISGELVFGEYVLVFVLVDFSGVLLYVRMKMDIL